MIVFVLIYLNYDRIIVPITLLILLKSCIKSINFWIVFKQNVRN